MDQTNEQHINYIPLDKISLLQTINDNTISNRSANISMVQPPKRAINDELTKYINKYLIESAVQFKNPVEETKILSSRTSDHFLKFVSHIFGDIFQGELNLPPINAIENYELYENINRPSTYMGELTNNPQIYFIFKGGNMIKYWTLHQYFLCQSEIDPNILTIGEILSSKIIGLDDMGGINSYSDFDFTIYVDNINDELYKNFIQHMYHRVSILRNVFADFFDLGSINTYVNNPQLKKKIAAYASIPQDAANLNLLTAANTKDFFLQKKDAELVLYTIDNPTSLNVSYNNTIKTPKSEFDLFRIKMLFDCLNNRQPIDSFKSEIFDLSIARNEYATSFIEHIDKYVKTISYDILDTNGQNTNITLNVLSNYYLIKDIASILYLDSIFAWDDIKYEKRLVRLAYLTCIYLNDDSVSDRDRSLLKLLIILLSYGQSLHSFDTSENVGIIDHLFLIISSVLDENDAALFFHFIYQCDEITPEFNQQISDSISTNFFEAYCKVNIFYIIRLFVYPIDEYIIWRHKDDDSYYSDLENYRIYTQTQLKYLFLGLVNFTDLQGNDMLVTLIRLDRPHHVGGKIDVAGTSSIRHIIKLLQEGKTSSNLLLKKKFKNQKIS